MWLVALESDCWSLVRELLFLQGSLEWRISRLRASLDTDEADLMLTLYIPDAMEEAAGLDERRVGAILSLSSGVVRQR